jgi:hypothetical protein
MAKDKDPFPEEIRPLIGAMLGISVAIFIAILSIEKHDLWLVASTYSLAVSIPFLCLSWELANDRFLRYRAVWVYCVGGIAAFLAVTFAFAHFSLWIGAIFIASCIVCLLVTCI